MLLSTRMNRKYNDKESIKTDKRKERKNKMHIKGEYLGRLYKLTNYNIKM